MPSPSGGAGGQGYGGDLNLPGQQGNDGSFDNQAASGYGGSGPYGGGGRAANGGGQSGRGYGSGGGGAWNGNGVGGNGGPGLCIIEYLAA